MLTQDVDVTCWSPTKVAEWLSGLSDDKIWFDREKLEVDKIGGEKLLLMTADDLKDLGAIKVNLQERILEAIENLRYYNYNITSETLQTLILKLACQSRSLQRQLATSSSKEKKPADHLSSASGEQKNIILSNDLKITSEQKQRVSLDSLASVSSIVSTVRHITDIISCLPYSKFDDYRSMKSLLLALSIELTSTAQRDQFVEEPNNILEKSSKALSDYCDRIVHGTRDPLLIQPFQLEKVRIRKSVGSVSELGLTVKSTTIDNTHVIDKISPLSPIKKTIKLSEGDEILQFNECIVGWSKNNVKKLLETSDQLNDIILMVKKRPSE